MRVQHTEHRRIDPGFLSVALQSRTSLQWQLDQVEIATLARIDLHFRTVAQDVERDLVQANLVVACLEAVPSAEQVEPVRRQRTANSL